MYFNVDHHGTDNNNHQGPVPKSNSFEASLKGFPNVPYTQVQNHRVVLFPDSVIKTSNVLKVVQYVAKVKLLFFKTKLENWKR